MSNYYQPEIETMPYEELRQLQNARFMKQIRHVWENVPYYRAKMEAKGVTIDDIHSIEYFNSQGLTKMTIGSCAMNEYKNIIKKKNLGEKYLGMVLFYRFLRWLAIDKGAKRIHSFGCFFS